LGRVGDDEIPLKEWSKNHLQCLKIAHDGSAIYAHVEDIKQYIFKFSLVDTCFPTMQIDYERVCSVSLNLGTRNVVKTPKPHHVTIEQK